MMMYEKGQNKIIIVEGITDKRQLEKILTDHTKIICTNGTLGIERFDELLDDYQLDDHEVFILVDENRAGIELRKMLSRELSHAKHIYISEEYGEVALTPKHILAITLVRKGFHVNPLYLNYYNK